jgi:hypothetical protein
MRSRGIGRRNSSLASMIILSKTMQVKPDPDPQSNLPRVRPEPQRRAFPQVAHLPARNRVPRIAGQTGIVNHRHGKMGRQEFSHAPGVLAVQPHPRHQRLHAAQNQPAVKMGKAPLPQPVGIL